ncbi:Nrap protein [Hygrophoropsis aurantiaca]|uniref:Nrap protein n=1 Tax=Hygrophoropsis aurantiaca TaxID=72124 RepID=A0ACB8A8K3_9AGAM|nr:Nrap protein [Hygrophoropsis aurantiaca]
MALNLKRKRDKVAVSSAKRHRSRADSDSEESAALSDPSHLSGSEIHEESNSDDNGDADEPPPENDMTLDQGGDHKSKKPPTGEELRVIKDAAELYRSGSFKLQIDALLPHVRAKESRKPPLDRFLLSLHSFLMSLPSVDPQNPIIASQTLLKQGIVVAYALPLPTRESKWKVGFEKPSDITVVGSWANQISVKRKYGIQFRVDLAVEMPDALFQEKDYLDGRFFHKRSYYLAIIAAAISKKMNVEILFDAALGDPRLTVLTLRPKTDGSQTDFSRLQAEVRIIPVLSPSSPIQLHRLSPSHSNVRLSAEKKHEPTPTPIYNTAILLSVFPKSDLLFTHQLQESCPAFRDAYTLLRIWAHQRGYGGGSNMCVRGFEGKGAWWASLLGLLITGEEPSQPNSKKGSVRRPLGRGLSSYQLFRGALDFLAKHKFAESAVFVKASNGHRFPPEEYVAQHSATFVDSKSTVNLLADVPLTSLESLMHDAKKTLEQLASISSTDDAFSETFLKDQSHLCSRFDAVIRIDLARIKPSLSALSVIEHGSFDNAMLSALSAILRRGLGDRAQAITLFHPPSKARTVSEAQPGRMPHIYVGLIYNPGLAFRLVDQGPPVEEQESQEAKHFREIWGNKAELRRFKDGRIIESVVWDVKTSDERAHIPALIVRQLLHQHFGLPTEDIQTLQAPFDSLLRLPDDVVQLHQKSGAIGGFKPAISAFDNLVKTLKSLDEQLPLALLNVSPLSEYLRYTSAFNPLPIPPSTALALPESLRYLPTMEIILEFEKSSKWPDDLRAIQKIKLAFFETIATALMSSSPGTKATVVVGDSSKASGLQDQSALEIVTPQGWAFSARIWHDREATLLNRIISSNKPPRPLLSDNVNAKEVREANEAWDLYQRRFIHTPRHHRAIANLCHRFGAFSGTVRLVKRWLASHWLLRGHILEEAVEILCAKFFVGAGALSTENAPGVPRSKERAFALVVEFLKDWKWEEPLFVPLYESGDVSSIPNVVAMGSKQGVWTISTAEDKGGRIWTSSGPDIVAAHRIRSLAQAAWTVISKADIDDLEVKSLFHPLDDYHILIELNAAVLPRYYHSFNANSNTWSRSNAASAPGDGLLFRPGFDPAKMFIDDLERTFAETLKFFYDPYGGNRIGAVWLDTLDKPRPFRALGSFSSTPLAKEKEKSKDSGLVNLNKLSVLEEIGRMGTGLISKITSRQ